MHEGLLDDLFKHIHCPTCNESLLQNVKKSALGTSITMKTSCVKNDHEFIWRSEPLLRKMPAFNLLYSAATIFSGKSWVTLLGYQILKFIAVPKRPRAEKMEADFDIPS